VHWRPLFRWSLPGAIELVDEVPHTAAGEALKMRLREPNREYTPAKV
jgi:acyl-CoA synthetase (AMP-forming)/AMP-acid ligase II